MPSTTRQKLIEAATKRFYRDGFRNVGIDQILSDVGISKTAFYKHFECKDDLMLAALEQKDLWLRKTLREMIHQHGGNDPVSQLHALFDTVGTFIESPEFQGCIFVNVTMEFPLPTEPAHQAAARNRQAIEEMVSTIATEAGAADPLALAQELCMIMEGAYVTHQVTRKPDTVAIARRLALRAIDNHLLDSKRALAVQSSADI